MESMINSADDTFKSALSNLIFSANNPFQSGFNYVVDKTYLKKYGAMQIMNYTESTSIGFIVNDQWKQYDNREIQQVNSNRTISTSSLFNRLEKKLRLIDVPLAELKGFPLDF